MFYHGGTGEKFCITNDGKHTLAPGTLGLANGLGGRVLDTWWIKATMAGAARLQQHYMANHITILRHVRLMHRQVL